MDDDIRLVPNKQAYEEAMKEFYTTLVLSPPRSLATTKVALTTSASRTFTRQYGIEWNLLMTKLEGEERTLFGFNSTPWRRHFAVKIYGKVYEFGPWPEQVRKTLFLDWCLSHLDFEFASIVDKISGNGFSSEIRRPVAAFTMKSEEEFDVKVQETCNFLTSVNRKYDPETLTCFIFIKVAHMFLNAEDSPDCEMSRWISTFAETLCPIMRRNILKIHRRMHPFVGDHGVGNRIAEIEILDSDGETDMDEDISCDTTSPGSCTMSEESAIEVIHLD